MRGFELPACAPDLPPGTPLLDRVFLFNMEPKKQFKGVWIPAEIWEDANLTWQDKCLLAEIHSLSGEEGCYASNAYLASKFGLSEKRMANKLTELRNAGYVITVKFDGRQRWLRVCWDVLLLRQDGKAAFPESGKADIPESGKADIPESGNTDISIENSERKKEQQHRAQARAKDFSSSKGQVKIRDMTPEQLSTFERHVGDVVSEMGLPAKAISPIMEKLRRQGNAFEVDTHRAPSGLYGLVERL